MKVQVAARQLSRSVANAINVWSISNMNDMFPAEALETAEFVELIDNLFYWLIKWVVHIKMERFIIAVCKITRLI